MSVLLATCLLTNIFPLVNDGALSISGSPKLLTSHPSIRMDSEVIKLRLRGYTVYADCQFVFLNDGSDCKVKIGFPDEGSGGADPYDYDEELWRKGKPRSVLKNFKSWVNDKPVIVNLERGSKPFEVFHTKTVQVPARSRMTVRNTYEFQVGGGIGPDNDVSANCMGYVLSTGASWKGRIGSTRVIIDLGPRYRLRSMQYAKTAKYFETLRFKSFRKLDEGVLCKAPVRPTLSKSVLTFSLENWRPTKDSDIFLYFGAIRMQDLIGPPKPSAFP